MIEVTLFSGGIEKEGKNLFGYPLKVIISILNNFLKNARNIHIHRKFEFSFPERSLRETLRSSRPPDSATSYAPFAAAAHATPILLFST